MLKRAKSILGILCILETNTRSLRPTRAL